jgi:hypothetical protein
LTLLPFCGDCRHARDDRRVSGGVLTLPILAGRDCGGCTVCCTVLPADDETLRKQAGVDCVHCDAGVGCRIYEVRPNTCREFFCGWRALPKLTDEWRPDRSGVMVAFDDTDIPPGYAIRPAFKLILTQPKVQIAAEAFAGYVAGLVDARIPVFLSLPGPPGSFFAKVFLNDRLAMPVARRDLGAVLDAFEAIYAELADGEFEPVVLSAPLNP